MNEVTVKKRITTVILDEYFVRLLMSLLIKPKMIWEEN